MTRTSEALKRLGVVGIAAVTIGAGVPAFFATSASANHVTTVTLSPDQQAGEPGACNPFTANIAPAPSATASGTVDVQIEQSVTRANTAAPAPVLAIEFCTPTAGTGPNIQGPGTGGFGGTTTTSETGVVSAPNGAGTCPTSAAVPNQAGTETTRTARCTAEFQVDASGNVTFGVRSNTTGQVRVTAFAEELNANGGTAGNRTGNNTPNVGEVQDVSTLFIVTSGQAAVNTVDCEPETATGTQGGFVDFLCTATGANPAGGGNTLPINGAELSYIVTAGPDANQTPVACGATDVNGAQPGTNATTNQSGQQVCRVFNTSNTPGTDTVFVYAEQNGQAGPQTGEPNDQVIAVFSGAPRAIDCEPETANAGTGTEQVVQCTVTDVNGTAVRNTAVRFTLSGVGRIANNECDNDANNDQCVLITNAAGQTRLFVRSDNTGTSTILAEIGTAASSTEANFVAASTQTGSECRQPAGSTTSFGVNATGRAAGVCADEVTRTFGNVPASPGATPTAGTASPNPSGSGTPNIACTVPATVQLERDTITATGSSGVTVRATPNSVIDLFAYSRPSTTFRVVRSAEVGQDGVAEFRIVPPTNTRLYAQQRGCNASQSVVLNVRTQLSLNVVRNGTRNYTFSGRALPARNGGLIVSLYRVTASGQQILTSQTRANAATGTYVINRVFTGTGRFGFVVRTGQDLQNAPGASNVRSLLVF